MAKQTFTTGQVLLASQLTNLQQTAMLGGSASIKTVSYTLVAADAGSTVAMNSASSTTITVNQNLFIAGDIVTIYNTNTGVSTITAGTATVTTSGSLALSQNQGGVLHFTSASAAIFFQFATPASGDIEGVTAGTGISGGGTSGTVTITNSMATAIDAKGDLVAGTGADAFSRLAVGSNNTVLTADSAEATGLKWAAPAAGGGYTELATGSLSGATTRIQSISADYRELVLIVKGFRPTNTSPLGRMYLRVNNDSGNNYWIMTAAGASTAGSVPFYALGNINYPQICDTMSRTDYTESILIATFPDYARTDTDHLYRADVKYTYSTDSAGYFTQGLIAYVPSTPAAINEIDIFTSEGTWDSGSYILYGVK